ncbi:MAG: InlB B-repeat-containing protein, partial [Acholeplasmataceae bacterium]
LSPQESLAAITISQTHTAIVTSAERLLTFGNNDNGQLATDREGPIREPWFYRLYDEMNVGYDQVIDRNDPLRQGFVFSGWYLDPDLTDPWTDERMPDRDVVLYGRFLVE